MHQTRIQAADPPPALSRRRGDRPRGIQPTPAAALRVEGLGLTAPWLGGLSVACAVAVLWALARAESAPMLGAWAALVVAVNWVAIRARRRAADHPDGLLASAQWVVLETATHAGLWATLPALAFPHQSAPSQLVLAGAMVAMMSGAVLLAIVPVAATIWAAALGAASLWALRHGGLVVTPGFVLLLAAHVGVVLIGCLIIERLLSRHIAVAGEERARAESISLLLHEYEEQGVGWLWQIDAANLFTYASPRIAMLLGRSTAQLAGQSLPVMLGPDARLGGALVAREPFSHLQVEVQTALGARVLSLSGSPMFDAEGRYGGFRGIGADVTESRRSEQRLTEAARHDMLTGLPNRLRMGEIVAEAVEASLAPDGAPRAILFLDLDGFKPVNDNFGHSTGDAVLRIVANRLRREIGAAGQIGRIGGDEFALVLHDGSNRRQLEALGRRIVAAVAEPCLADGVEARVGVSIGCAVAPVDGSSVDELLKKADLALYHAKSIGRGTFCHFSPTMQHAADDRLKLEQDLRQALAREQLSLAYQPIVSAGSQEILGFEALLRWRHPERGLVPPAVFIPIAEETGLIAEIGAWVLAAACRDAADWPDQLTVSVNLSPRQLTVPALPDAVAKALARARLAPNRLELEVTESIFLSDSDGSLDVLRRVRALGVGIALDDFGTGYSSLGYLNKSVFHTLKIDGSFVRDAADKAETGAIIEAIVALARSFRMTTIAEGIEMAEDADRMRRLGCDRLQGYLFGRPMPYLETIELVGTKWDPLRAVG